jgi:hypothetical protein
MALKNWVIETAAEFHQIGSDVVGHFSCIYSGQVAANDCHRRTRFLCITDIYAQPRL